MTAGIGAGAAALALFGTLTGRVAVVPTFNAAEWVAGIYLGVAGGALIRWIGPIKLRSCRNHACPQSGRADPDRQDRLRQPAGISYAQNFAAIARRRTRGDAQSPPLRPVQHLLVRAALDQTPYWLRTILGLNGYGLRAWELAVVRNAGELADRLVLETNPAVQACRRMRLPVVYLYA
jgi:hypothetical protein